MSPDTLARVLLVVVTLVLSIGVHEFAHAFAAWKLGDDTAARQGRLTLNPFAHADPLGTLILPAFFAFSGFGGFGWGKPVPYVPTNLSRRFSMRGGEAIVAFAGPASNLVLAVVSGALLGVLLKTQLVSFESPFIPLLQQMIVINLVLFFFNLLPVPPLDGSKIFAWLFGQRADRILDGIHQTGPIALIVVVLVGGRLISPFVGRFYDTIVRYLVL